MKNIFFIWLGNNIPAYVNYAINMFKNINLAYNCIFIHYTIKQIEDIYINDNIKTDYDRILKESIVYLFDNIHLIKQRYSYEISSLNYDYKNIRVIQILANIFRTFIINNYTGIYLDCDTFPVKQFDDLLFEKHTFVVNRHSSLSNNSIVVDNYFFGSDMQNSFTKNKIELNDYKTEAKNILQTVPNWQNNIKFKIAQKKFFACKLKFGEFSFNDDFYITHFADGCWRLKNNYIRVQHSLLDDKLQELIYD